MRVLGVDCGSRVTGYGVIDVHEGECVLVRCGAIAVGSSQAFHLRLKAIHEGLVEIIRLLEPNVAAFEGMFHSANVQSALKLGQARGVSILAATAAGLDVFEYSPAEVKSAVTGYGRAEKIQVQQMVGALLKMNVPPEPYDASDALAVAICHAHTHRFRSVASARS